jgi:hypothetical protein
MRIGIIFFMLAIMVAGPALADPEIPPAVDTAVGAGLAFLARQQNADGSLEGGGPRIAMTGLALMSFLAAGNVPDEGKYGLAVRSAMEFLIRSAPADGYFGKVDGSRMYGQGIATVALAEAYGADHDPARRARAARVLRQCVQVFFNAQDIAKPANFAGGWRYEPTNQDSDLSLSGWGALSLRAAANIGIDVPGDRVSQAVGFVMRCYRADQGGFAYQPGADSSIAMTGVGMLNLYLLEGPDRPELASAGRFLLAHPVTDDTRMLYYSLYYSTQAAYQAGDATWPTVWNVTRTRLLRLQNAQDGGWPQSPSGEEPGRVYASSMAILSLSVPYRLLPIYQR